MNMVTGNETTQLEGFKLRTVLGVLLATLVGAALALGALPALVPSMTQSLTGEIPHAYWYLSRTSGFVAYVLLWLSMVFGLLLTNKLAKSTTGIPAAFDLHQFTSLLGLAFTLFHALILLGDKYIGYSLAQLIVPFSQQDFKPVWVGVGQLGFYLMAVVTFTFYIRELITQRGWRLVHYASFAMWMMALGHGLLTGTDTGVWWADAIYWVTGASTLFLTVYRVLAAKWVDKKAVRQAAQPRA